MIESWLFIFAVIMVLFIPDSSNAILANSAHQQGILKTLTFIPIEILGYFYGISLWALIVHLSLPVWPVLLHILHVGSVLYILWLASRLWKSSQLERYHLRYPQLKSKHLFLTILKNPKTILFAVGIFPFETWDSFENYILVFAVFFLCLIFCSLFGMYFRRTLWLEKFRGINANHYYKGSAMLLMIGMLPVFFDFLDEY